MRNNIFKRSLALFLALVCVLGILPLSAFAATNAPASITQISSAYVTINGRYARYEAASSAINSVGMPYVFNEQVDIPGYGPGRALCAYQLGTLGSGANGQKWNFEQEVTHPSLVAILTYVYSFTNGTFTDSGKAVGLGAWNEPWANLWFMVAQAMSWLHEHGVIIDYTVDRAGFARQLAEEFVAAYKMYHDVYGWSDWITDWRGRHHYTTLTKEADKLIAGQYKITEVSAPEGYIIQNAARTVTVLPNDTAGCTFTFYNANQELKLYGLPENQSNRTPGELSKAQKPQKCSGIPL